jgi:hypothetical protein
MRLTSSFLLTTAGDAVVSAIITSKTRPQNHIGRPSARESRKAELQHRARDRRGELRAMIEIDIFKENHRFSN